jgi:hypothetical protein
VSFFILSVSWATANRHYELASALHAATLAASRALAIVLEKIRGHHLSYVLCVDKLERFLVLLIRGVTVGYMSPTVSASAFTKFLAAYNKQGVYI